MLGLENLREGLAHKWALQKKKGPQEVKIALMSSQDLSTKGTVMDL